MDMDMEHVSDEEKVPPHFPLLSSSNLDAIQRFSLSDIIFGVLIALYPMIRPTVSTASTSGEDLCHWKYIHRNVFFLVPCAERHSFGPLES